MKTKTIAACLIGSALASGALAQTVESSTPPPAAALAPVVVPTSPAPTVQGQNPVSAPAATAPSQTIYASRLPTPAELSDGAAKQGLAIDRIEQSPTQVTVVYRYSDGQTKAVAYHLLPTSNATVTAPAPVVIPASPVPTSSPSVIYYDTTPRVIYYDRGPYYFNPPVSVQLGFGFGHHHHRGHGFGFRHRH